MSVAWWQIVALYFLGGAASVFTVFLWEKSSDEQEDMEEGLVFIFWPLLLVGLAVVAFLYIPKSIRWIAERLRASIEKDQP